MTYKGKESEEEHTNHFVVQLKLIQCCKSTILQLKKINIAKCHPSISKLQLILFSNKLMRVQKDSDFFRSR